MVILFRALVMTIPCYGTLEIVIVIIINIIIINDCYYVAC